MSAPERFHCGEQIGTYVGMIPSEDSSARKQRLGHIRKQGNSWLRFLLVEAAQAAARSNPEWRRRYMHLVMRRHKSIAKVAMGRKLGFACTGCGGTVVRIRRRSSSVRTWDSSVPDMV
jgi:transposase